jgi:hypothetical protein
MKIKILIALILPLLFLGCDDLFDEGDVQKTFDDIPQVEFKPLQQEVSISSLYDEPTDDGTFTVAVQLIAPQRDSDLAVNFSVGGNSTAQAGVHYNIVTPSPVTISAGTSSVDVVIELIEGSLESGSADLFLNLEGGSGVPAAPNLDESRTIIQP